MTAVRLRWDGGSVRGTLDACPTADALLPALPLTAPAGRWGALASLEAGAPARLDARPQTVVEPGVICYWTQGRAVLFPFGPTPIAEASECRLVTACNVIGKVDGEPRQLASIAEGMTLTLERIE